MTRQNQVHNWLLRDELFKQGDSNCRGIIVSSWSILEKLNSYAYKLNGPVQECALEITALLQVPGKNGYLFVRTKNFGDGVDMALRGYAKNDSSALYERRLLLNQGINIAAHSDGFHFDINAMSLTHPQTGQDYQIYLQRKIDTLPLFQKYALALGIVDVIKKEVDQARH